MKITTKQVETQEQEIYIEALTSGVFALNDEFLARYCSDEVAQTLHNIPENERAFYLEGNIGRAWFNGFPARNAGIMLNVSEVEVQFEGAPEEYFEEPKDFTFSGDCAYLNVGYGLSIEVDTESINAELAA